jgi:transcriptional regulator NrdR family protein
LVKVNKRSEDFDKEKLEESLKRAGAREEHALLVADSVARRVQEEISTVEIRKMAATELRRVDAKAATVYEEYPRRRSW